MRKIITILLSVLIIAGATAASYAAVPVDGTYSVSVTMTGGSGRASIKSPTTLIISGGQMKAKIVWSSENYTWMKVNGVQYNNENSGGNSTFTIPVSALDTPISVSAETVAMSEPHVIEYQITVSSAGVTMKDSTAQNNNQQVDNAQNSNVSKESTKDNKSTGSSNKAETNTSSGQGDIVVNEGEEAQTSEQSDQSVIEVVNPYSKTTSVSADLIAASAGKTMKLTTAKGEVTFDEEAVAAIAKSAKGGISLTMDVITDKEPYKDQDYDMVVDLSLKDDEGNSLYDSEDLGKATVVLNYDKETGDSDKEVKLYRIDGDSKEEIEAIYDEEANTVTFETTHFSVYAIAQESTGGMNVVTVAVILGTAVVIALMATIIYTKKKRTK